MQALDSETTRLRLAFLAGGESRGPTEFDDLFLKVHEEVDLDTITHAQLNKLLVAAGHSRVSHDWFEFFSSLDETGVGSVGSFDRKLTAWRKLAMLNYANFRHPFRKLRNTTSPVINRALRLEPAMDRNISNSPLDIQDIPERDRPFLGYIAGGMIQALKAEKESSLDDDSRELIERHRSAEERGSHNLYEYVTAERMDIYVATSMRTSEDFYAVARFTRAVFNEAEEDVAISSLTHFDPTVSSHDDRLIKGVVEGLMLKRAQMTVYLAQEGDTLGKDSELATTLIQGKPVIVFVPEIDDPDKYISQLREDLKRAASDDPSSKDHSHPEHRRFIDRYRSLPPKYWGELLLSITGQSDARDAVFDSDEAYSEALTEYTDALASLYDKRASDFRDNHPLGVQVIMSSGVPNGVLVVRTVEHCQKILKDIVRHSLNFNIEGRTADGSKWVDDFEAPTWSDRKLIEASTGCVYRFALGENPISNSFWNWYIDETANEKDT